MALHADRVLSRPCEVHFAGFRSDTHRLQSSGWQLSVEQDFCSQTIRLAMKFEPARLFMLSNRVPCEFFSMADQGWQPLPVFNMTHCASNMVVQLMESVFDFKAIDATPQYSSVQRRGIEDFGIFATPQVRTEEIIIEPQSVAECLDLIRKMQAPELAAIRERNRRRNEPGSTAQPVMQQTFHAQILSLAA